MNNSDDNYHQQAYSTDNIFDSISTIITAITNKSVTLNVSVDGFRS